jgi:cell division protein FtsN
MTKDYAKKREPNRSYATTKGSKGHARPTVPGWFWLFSGVVLGVGLAVFIFWKWGQGFQYQPPQPPIVISETDSAPVIDKSIEENDDDEKSRFDFYTLLPNLKVDMPDIAAPKETRKPSINTDNSGMAYILQTGSFRTHTKAEQLKATLALSGFESRIQTVTIPPDETWYRVYIGPFETKNEALVMQQNLQLNQAANSLILKIRV